MNINPEIKKVLQQFNIEESYGVLALLGIYHDLDISIIHEITRKQLNLTKIVERDYENPGKLIWNIPLYSSEVISDEWDWVQEWRGLFGKLRNDAIGDKKGCLVKMKKFFAEHPEIRKDDILSATSSYLRPFYQGKENVKYLQRADYFISKIMRAEGGTQYSSRLDMYLEILKNQQGTQTQQESRLNQIVR